MYFCMLLIGCKAGNYLLVLYLIWNTKYNVSYLQNINDTFHTKPYDKGMFCKHQVAWRCGFGCDVERDWVSGTTRQPTISFVLPTTTSDT